ncbi:MAG: phenylalanine--tRNA ligase subunit beta, partial [Anaerolineales bacterium]|nr:phenylalanine--tRNA ligase subunit beta [Anaerolineales bacterium]
LLTFAGLEVEAMEYIGLPQPHEEHQQTKITGLEWGQEHFVVADITAVDPHPNADRLVLAQLHDGERGHTILTGAPNLFHFKGKGPFSVPLKVAYAREGARLYDGHMPGREVTTIKRTKIRGVESYSMACSEKELGISDEHEGVIIFDADAPPAGTPLADYIGDVVFDISTTPNMARNASVVGVARELAALTGGSLRLPPWKMKVASQQSSTLPLPNIDIRDPDLNPRFTATLIENVKIAPSPYWLQRRLRLAGMRPINNIVDITNYVMLETGQPLHAFDYDVLRQRAGGKTPTIITRLPKPEEKLTTLDGVERALDDFTIMVADTAGALSIGGIMGGGESEVTPATTNVLLEVASWDLINIRRSVHAQQLQSSQAGYRFSRGVHPAIAPRANRRAAEMMRELGGGRIAQELIEEYPRPFPPVVAELPLAEIERNLGITIPTHEVIRILTALEFGVEKKGAALQVSAPEHRLDIGVGAVGIADLVEEIARIYGFERIPETQISDTTPPQHSNLALETEERLRDILVNLGLQEVITYRLSSPELEQRTLGTITGDYVTLNNPVAPERAAMRRSLLASVLECAQSNVRFQERMALFEMGPVYFPESTSTDGQPALPRELRRLVIVLSGTRSELSWTDGEPRPMDYFDLKGLVDALVDATHLPDISMQPTEHPSFRPGATAALLLAGSPAGIFGELHPRVSAAFALTKYPVLAADFDLETLLPAWPDHHLTKPVPRFPAIVEDIALIVDRTTPATDVTALIVQTGGKRLARVQLFDVFHSAQLGADKKSLAFRLAFQSEEKTLTDKDAARLRNKIVKRLAQEIGAELRDA